MSEFDYKREVEFDGGDEVFSKVVRAGRRTYFFDVKATRANDYYLTVTESRKKQGKNGDFTFEKHKLFLYKEDFSKFIEGLEVAINFIKNEKPEFFIDDAPALANDKIEEEDSKLSTDNTILTVTEEEFDNL